MTHVMLREQQPVTNRFARAKVLELPSEHRLLEQLVVEPNRHRSAKRAESMWREGDVRLEETLELQEWLLVVGDVIDRIERRAGRAQTIRDRIRRKAFVVTASGEALLLRRGFDRPVG